MLFAFTCLLNEKRKIFRLTRCSLPFYFIFFIQGGESASERPSKINKIALDQFLSSLAAPAAAPVLAGQNVAAGTSVGSGASTVPELAPGELLRRHGAVLHPSKRISRLKEDMAAANRRYEQPPLKRHKPIVAQHSSLAAGAALGGPPRHPFTAAALGAVGTAIKHPAPSKRGVGSSSSPPLLHPPAAAAFGAGHNTAAAASMGYGAATAPELAPGELLRRHGAAIHHSKLLSRLKEDMAAANRRYEPPPPRRHQPIVARRSSVSAAAALGRPSLLPPSTAAAAALGGPPPRLLPPSTAAAAALGGPPPRLLPPSTAAALTAAQRFTLEQHRVQLRALVDHFKTISVEGRWVGRRMPTSVEVAAEEDVKQTHLLINHLQDHYGITYAQMAAFLGVPTTSEVRHSLGLAGANQNGGKKGRKCPQGRLMTRENHSIVGESIQALMVAIPTMTIHGAANEVIQSVPELLGYTVSQIRHAFYTPYRSRSISDPQMVSRNILFVFNLFDSFNFQSSFDNLLTLFSFLQFPFHL